MRGVENALKNIITVSYHAYGKEECIYSTVL